VPYPTHFLAAAALTLAFTVGVVVAQWRGRAGAAALQKGLASAGFLAAAAAAGAADGRYGRILGLGLVLSAAGDLFLIGKARRWFLAGLGAFLLAHLAYAAAFVGRGSEARLAGLALLPLLVGAALVVRWLWPHVPARMRPPVLAYVAAITAMVAAAAGTRAPLVVAGAVLFFLSDLFVARERFVAPGIINRAVGLPLYYVAQLLLAATSSGG
jgi:uncharacterized membrane protein YhhN